LRFDRYNVIVVNGRVLARTYRHFFLYYRRHARLMHSKAMRIHSRINTVHSVEVSNTRIGPFGALETYRPSEGVSQEKRGGHDAE